jgi:hypothetical protein
MATCFLNNVYYYYLPTYYSYSLQLLDNRIFNTLKVVYRKKLEKLVFLTDSIPVGKVNFIRAYTKARIIGMTSKNIRSGWRVTGNWPVSRAKALRHPEIQVDEVPLEPTQIPKSPYLGSDDIPKTSRHIRDLGINKTPNTRRRYTIIAKGFESQELAIV